jgi:hypothetical protein
VTKSRRIRWKEYVARIENTRNVYNISVGKREGKRPLGRSRRRWQDNIRIYLREIGRELVGWIHLAQKWDM